MALDSLFSRLFGAKPGEPEETEPERPPVPEPPPAQPPPQCELLLPPEHSMHRLWSAYCQQAGWIPQPVLRLDLPPGGVMSHQDTQKELARLQMTVNSTANGRLRQLKPKPKKGAPEGEPPPPPPDLDAQAVVFTSSSLLTSWLLVYPPCGQGKELDRELLDKALRENKVCFGLDEALLDELPGKQERYFHIFPAAQGRPAVHGVDGRVVDLFPRTAERTVTPDENNRVDYTSLDFVHNVEEGGMICKIIQPTKGTPGRTVQDKEVPARDGKAPAVPSGRNTRLSEDGSALLAAIAGHVEFSGRSFQVRPLLEIPGNVDFSSGNINFLGDVHVRGDIRSGFTVRAMGNITVDGVVEACTVEAGGDLLVSGGVQGDNQAVIRAQRSVFAKYLENASVYVRDSLHTDCIINCNVYCDGSVDVRSGRMTIIGGSVRAAHEVSAGIIGSRMEGRTDIVLGGQPCADFDYDILAQEVRQLEEDLAKTERQPDSPYKLSRMSKERMQLMVNRRKLDQLDREKELLASDPEEAGLRRLTCAEVYPGTVLSIGAAVYRFERKIHPCVATLADGEIRLI